MNAFVLGIFFLIGGLSLLHRGRGGKMTRQGCIAVILGFTILGCSIIDIVQSLSTSFLNLLPPALPTEAPTIIVPTLEPSNIVEYFLDFDVNALCISDGQALERLESSEIFIRYTDYSSGEREMVYENLRTVGLSPPDFPWSTQFTLRKSSTRSGEKLLIEVEMPTTMFDSCHVMTCTIRLNGVEVGSGNSIVKDNGGTDRANPFAECAVGIDDLDLK